MTDLRQIRGRLEVQGFAIVEDLLTRDAIGVVLGSLGETAHSQRNLLANAVVAGLAERGSIPALVDGILGSGAFPVRAILFDKIEGANWKVPWHQDLIIPVRQKVETPGFGGWSMKDGIPHVHPPAEVLAGMLTVRLHLDDCGPDNGPLRVIPESHRHGKLTTDATHRFRERAEAVVCTMEAGSALLMKPLLLHASSPAAMPGHRRVLHLEYAREALPAGLEWGRA